MGDLQIRPRQQRGLRTPLTVHCGPKGGLLMARKSPRIIVLDEAGAVLQQRSLVSTTERNCR